MSTHLLSQKCEANSLGYEITVYKDCLISFEYIDKSITTLEIMVDNYIAKLVKMVLDSDDIKIDLRDLKIKKMVAND